MPEAFSLYLHLPYCARRCPYCDFNTYVVHSMPEQRYVEAVLREMAWASDEPSWQGRRITTVFFGGGTPSLFSPQSIARILEEADARFGFGEAPEITLEANPGSLEGGGEDKLRGFRAAGINRVSFGAQSFQAKHLATLGRIHSAEETRGAFDAARRAGFDNLSCDLIFGVPGQTPDEWRDDLRTAVSLGSEHVSAYGLTYEEGTPMTGMRRAGLVTAVDEEEELEMFRAAGETFAEAGFRRYEVSNFARPGRESRHNLAYWTWRDYLGLGAGAHGFAAGAGDAFARRWSNVRLPETYMSAAEGAWAATREDVSRSMAMAEFLMVGLRLADGVSKSRFREVFGCTAASQLPDLGALVADGMVDDRPDALALSAAGLEVADAVIGRLAASIA